MSASWVAATIRGKALARRLMGPVGVGELAASDSWDDARPILAASFYCKNLPGQFGRTDARRHAAAATTWQMRVLAGWLPPGHSALARLFAAPMEIANIEGRLSEFLGQSADPPIGLGSLASAWPSIARAASPQQVREILARSVWGDPGSLDRVVVGLSLRLVWARRLASQVPQAGDWARGAAAVLLARERFAFGREINEAAGRTADRLLGSRWRAASSLPALTARLPKDANWPLQGLDDPSDLWRAEAALAQRAAEEAARHARSMRFERLTVAGILALLLVDLQRVTAAIEIAGRRPIPQEILDALA